MQSTQSQTHCSLFLKTSGSGRPLIHIAALPLPRPQAAVLSYLIPKKEALLGQTEQGQNHKE